MSFSMTAPKSLRELFDQLGLQRGPVDGWHRDHGDARRRTNRQHRRRPAGRPDRHHGRRDGRPTGLARHPVRHAIATTDLFIRYLRPIKVGPARAVARILRTGKRSVVVQVDIYRGNDDEVGATATVNFAAVD